MSPTHLTSLVAAGAVAIVPVAASSGPPPFPAQSNRALAPRVVPPAAGRNGRQAHADCLGTGPGSFVGSGSDNLAGGGDAGVMAGFGNQACDYSAAIGAGEYNIIFNSGNAGAHDAFIGAGANNTVAAVGSFVGAGYSN